MIHSVIAEKYAKALFELGKSKEETLIQDQELAAFIHAVNAFQDGSEFFNSPHIKRETKEEVLKRCPFSETTINFLKLLLRKGRFAILEDILREYNTLLKQKYGIIDAKLLSAIPIDPTTKDELKKKLSHLGSTVNLEEKMDDSLLGGGILSFNNRVLDFSLRGKLERLKKNLLSRSYLK